MSPLTRQESCSLRLDGASQFFSLCEKPLYIDWCRRNVRYLRERGVIAFVVIYPNETCCVFRSLWTKKDLSAWYREFQKTQDEAPKPKRWAFE